MKEVIFNGRFETNNFEKFLELLEDIMKKTDTQYSGKVMSFEVSNYTEYEEVEETGNKDSDIQS